MSKVLEDTSYSHLILVMVSISALAIAFNTRFGMSIFCSTASSSSGELTKKESEATGKIFQKMGVLLQTMGQEQNFTAILEKSSVLYAKNHLDLTNELIRRYNKAYPVKKTGKKK